MVMRKLADFAKTFCKFIFTKYFDMTLHISRVFLITEVKNVANNADFLKNLVCTKTIGGF